MTRLLAFGDLHLGAGTSLGRTPGDRLADQETVLGNIFGLACDRDVEAVLIAGDIFEGPLVTPEQMDVFAQFVQACAGVGRPVIAISGNGMHDAAMRSVNGLAIFNRLPGVTVHSRPALVELAECTIACLPWVSSARLFAQEGIRGERDRDAVNEIAAMLLFRIARGFAERKQGPTVLMLHGSISGASLPTGIATDDLREPVIDLGSLLDLDYDAIVASHIHAPQWSWSDLTGWLEATNAQIESADRLAVYTGSPMPLNFGEAGTAHGVWILDADGDDGTSAEFVPVPSRPFVQSNLDLATLDIPGVDAVTDFAGYTDPAAWPDVDEAIVKVCLRATRAQQRRLELGQLREAILGAGAHTVKIEIDTVREERSRVDGVTEDLDPLEAFDAWAAANGVAPTLAARVREQLQADLEAVVA